MNESNQTIRHERDQQLVDYANRVADQIVVTAAKYDDSGKFPYEHFQILEKEGYLKLTIPKEYGGRGLSLYETLLVQERLAKASGSTALSVGWHLMTFFSLSHFRPWKEEVFAEICRATVEEGYLLNVYMTERATGNIVRGGKLATTAQKSSSGYVLNGRKAFATLSPIIKQFTVLAYIEEEDKIAEFLVQKDDTVEIIDTWDVLGMRGTGSMDIVFHHTSLPETALLAYSEKGRFNRFTGKSSAYTLQLPAIYLGIAVAARDFILTYAMQRFSPSLNDYIVKAPHVQQKIGEIEALITVSRGLLYGLAEKWDSNLDIQDKLTHEVAVTKYAVCNNAIKIVELAMRIAGGHALSKGLPLERYFRDVQCGAYNPPLDDMVLQNIATAAIEHVKNRIQKEPYNEIHAVQSK
ncbi:acyl-CoA dehydrogenase family protein [Metasolibacillus meyeri]|uniref:acyl-CoA dehydrogenase family protein n=1 Tax=Metasolibacillus meyeri TaxID=1071052 RepID=UPI000D312D49|nr:acyl-CoA dehydrogenase family protein [Metasolibacillus meyeri]